MDRFEVCAAYYIVATRWHSGQGSKGYRILSRLADMRYSPGMLGYRRGSEERSAAARLLWTRRAEIRRTW